MNWVEALKIYNKNTPKWHIPKKGTPEHQQVLDIMHVTNILGRIIVE